MADSATDPSPLRTLDDLETVIDCDFHLTERQADFLPYLPDPFDSMLNREDTVDNMGYVKSLYPSAGLLTPINTGKVQNEPVRTREAVKEGMDLLGVEHPVLTPTQNLYLGCVHHDDLAAGLAHAYNQWLLDQILEPDAGIYGAAVIAPQKPEQAAEEIDDRADEDGIVAVFVPSGGINPLLGHDVYHPIYEAAEAAGLPVMFHNASGTQLLSFPQQFQATNRYLSNHATTHSMLHMSHLTDMLVRGVFVKYDLEFVFQEAGIGWVPYITRRLDNEYREKREDAPMLERLPSEYIDEACYFTSQPLEGADDPEYIKSIVSLMGPDNLLFSSDYPHLDFDHSDALFRAIRGSFDEDAVVDVYGETAQRVFGF